MQLFSTRTEVFAILLMLVCSMPGCLTIRHGSSQIISVDSAPQGATIEIQPGGQLLETPAKVVLARRHPYSIVVRKDGFESESIVIESKSNDLWRNLVWIHPVGWIIGIVVDLSTGAAKELEPSAVSVELTPSASDTAGTVPGS